MNEQRAMHGYIARGDIEMENEKKKRKERFLIGRKSANQKRKR